MGGHLNQIIIIKSLNYYQTHVTWTNIFVNSNYEYFKDKFLPEFNKWEGRIILYANKEGINKKLPFKVDKYIPLNLNSWKEPEVSQLIESSKTYSDEEENQIIFLGQAYHFGLEALKC